MDSRRGKVVTAAQAIALIRDGDIVTTGGFVGSGVPDELLEALEIRWKETQSPRDLTLIFAAGQGDGKTRGLNRIGHKGLIKRVIGGHFGLCPKIGLLAMNNQIEAYNFPQGCISFMFDAVTRKSPFVYSKVGLGTFVDPRLEGGKVNPLTQEDLVAVCSQGSQEYLRFTCPAKIHVALIRGTTADPQGNITMDKEALLLDTLQMAMAVRNSGGLVICQVEGLAAPGTLGSREVKIPGVFIDCVVVSKPENHLQTYGTVYSPYLSGHLRLPLDSLQPLPLDQRKIISRRACLELNSNAIINLGIGMPEGVAQIANEELILQYLTLTGEAGGVGGLPMSGLNFGTSMNNIGVIPQHSMFQFYDGGGLDIAFLGMAQCDRWGNLNVSRFGGKLAGCGGFINISQNAKVVVFLGTFTAKGLKIKIEDGKLQILQEGAEKKFLESVEQITFSSSTALKNQQKVLYITERCVFALTREGLELIEVAPGISLEKDILPHMNFPPIIKKKTIKEMDSRIFQEGPMNLKSQMVSIPIKERIYYDPIKNILFLNFEGLKMLTKEDVKTVLDGVEDQLKAIQKKGVKAIVNYDLCTIDQDVFNLYMNRVQQLIETYQYSVTRYTTSAFLREKLGKKLEQRKLAPHIFETKAEAKAFLQKANL